MAKRTTSKKIPDKKKPVRKKKGLTKRDVLRKCEQLKNWGKWGRNDQLGVLNYITPKDIVDASQLINVVRFFVWALTWMKMAHRMVFLAAVGTQCII